MPSSRAIGHLQLTGDDEWIKKLSLLFAEKRPGQRPRWFIRMHWMGNIQAEDMLCLVSVRLGWVAESNRNWRGPSWQAHPQQYTSIKGQNHNHTNARRGEYFSSNRHDISSRCERQPSLGERCRAIANGQSKGDQPCQPSINSAIHKRRTQLPMCFYRTRNTVLILNFVQFKWMQNDFCWKIILTCRVLVRIVSLELIRFQLAFFSSMVRLLAGGRTAKCFFSLSPSLLSLISFHWIYLFPLSFCFGSILHTILYADHE